MKIDNISDFFQSSKQREEAYKRLQSGGGSGTGGGMEARVAKLEACVEHIEKDVAEIKADVRNIRQDIKIQLSQTTTKDEFQKFQVATKDEFQKINITFAEIKGKLSKHDWMLGLIIAGIATLIVKSFFGG